MKQHFNEDVLPPARQAGVSLHITSLPGRYGIGEIGQQAYSFVDTMRDMGLCVWQFLPLGPTAYGDSPYQPLSSFAGNPMLIDVDDLIGRGLLSRDEASELSGLPADYVDYGELIPRKTALLKRAASRFLAQADAGLTAAYEAFLERNDVGWLHDYALFRVLKSHHGERPWPEWSPAYVHREPAALGKVAARAADRIESIKIVQFLFFDQWRQLRDYANQGGIRLFGDMPIYVALDSADAWANRDILLLDEDGRPSHVAGVPPDYFSNDGQLWGNPLYDWDKHRASGFAWWIERMRASAELADIVRIDHFRGFESYWSIPADAETARVGSWEPGPRDEIFEAMQSALGLLPIVAEDLGVITPEVTALRDAHGVPGMVVLQFDVADEGFSLADVPDNCVCYTGTHDNDTTLGWFRGSPNDIRTAEEIAATQKAALEITGGSPETIAFDLVKAAYATDARLAIAPLQDYLGLGSEARINTPGTSSNNWRWRTDVTQLNGELCHNVAKAVRDSGREMLDDRRQTG